MRTTVAIVALLIAAVLSMGAVAEKKTVDNSILSGIAVVCLILAAKLVMQ